MAQRAHTLAIILKASPLFRMSVTTAVAHASSMDSLSPLWNAMMLARCSALSAWIFCTLAFCAGVRLSMACRCSGLMFVACAA